VVFPTPDVPTTTIRIRPRLRLPPAPARLIHHCYEGG
jgi:hypothetical protein